MTRLPEAISTVRRRRAWSTEEKVVILDAAFTGAKAATPASLMVTPPIRSACDRS